MHSSGRDFAAGVKSLDFGAGPGIDEYATAHVVGCRNDRNPFLGDVDACVHALGINVREVALDVLGGTSGKVDEHVVLAEALHFAVDGACHDVAGGKRVQRVHLVHEFFALVVLKDAAETAYRFGDEEGFLEARCVQTCGVELHEFDVLKGGPCTCCNGHAVSATVGRADCVLPDAACAAGREDGRFRVDAFDFAGLLVDDLGADAALVLAFAFANQVLDVAVFEVVYFLLLVKFAEEGAHNLFAGEVRGVQNAVVAVSAFEVEVELRLVFGRRCELDAPLDELLYGGWPALGQDVDGFFFAEPGARFEGVGDMELKFVCLLGYCGDAALRIVRRTIRLCSLG